MRKRDMLICTQLSVFKVKDNVVYAATACYVASNSPVKALAAATSASTKQS